MFIHLSERDGGKGAKNWTGTQPHKQFIINTNQVVMRETELFKITRESLEPNNSVEALESLRSCRYALLFWVYIVLRLLLK